MKLIHTSFKSGFHISGFDRINTTEYMESFKNAVTGTRSPQLLSWNYNLRYHRAPPYSLWPGLFIDTLLHYSYILQKRQAGPFSFDVINDLIIYVSRSGEFILFYMAYVSDVAEHNVC